MHGVILAGGEGSRLAQDGVATPKVTVAIAGRPQLVWLADALRAGGCATVTCLVRAHVPDAEALLAGREGVRVLRCETPSSLHTLALAIEAAPSGPLLCTLGDTVMPPADWRHVHAEAVRALAGGADGALVVTPFVQDEHPLWAEVDAAGRVRALPEEAPVPARVTAGVYVLGDALRATVRPAIDAGAVKLRQLLRGWLAEGRRLAAIDVARAVDLDRRDDLEAAEALLAGDAA